MFSRIRRLPLITAVALAATTGLVACGGSGSGSGSGSASSDGPVKVGALLFLTGPFSSYGQLGKQGVMVGQSYVNSHGGVLGGRKLEIDIHDTQSDPKQAIAGARQFASDKSVSAVLGPQGTPDLLALEPIASSLNVPFLPIGSTAVVPNSASNLFRVGLVASPDITKRFLQHVKQTDNVNSIGLITEGDNPAQTAEAGTVKAVAGSVGIKLTASETVTPPSTDYSAQLDKIMATHPDAIYDATVTPVDGQIMRQARARGFTGMFIGGSGLQDPGTAKIGGKAATGYEVYEPYNLSSSKKIVADFVAAYNKMYPNGNIGSHTVNGFDAILLLADAINRSKSTDRAALIKALQSTSNVDTVEGPYSFDSNGVNPHPSLEFLYMGADGKFTTQKPAGG